MFSSQLRSRAITRCLGPFSTLLFMRSVHFRVAKHDADPVRPPGKILANAAELLKVTWGQKPRELLQSSLVDPHFSTIHSKRNGFVETVVMAYNEHHHLVLRPDDVWIAILSQFNCYVNAHSEELRSHFVAHKGKKELVVEGYGNRYTVDFGNMAKQMTKQIHQNVVDKDLRDWILPDFSTTSNNDTVICAVLMMSTLREYFTYTEKLICGIPSVTLEGEKKDWEKLLHRLDKLKEFGEEPTAWAALLRPILTRFVKAFDGEPDLDFWGRVCHHQSAGSGPIYLSGWITAFCVWNGEGKWQGPPLSGPRQNVKLITGEEILQLSLDGVSYPTIETSHIPSGLADVDVRLDDNGILFDCKMASGHIATLVGGQRKDTVRPLPAWFMFIKEEDKGGSTKSKKEREEVRLV